MPRARAEPSEMLPVAGASSPEWRRERLQDAGCDARKAK
jgi:hypothetical protein